MKKQFLLIVCSFMVSMAFARDTNRNATYDVETKTLIFTGGQFNNCFYLPIEGDLSAFKSLVIDCAKCESSFRVKVTYCDRDGKVQQKDFYQNAKADGGAVTKSISLIDSDLITNVENIQTVSITSCEGAQTIVLNSVYLKGKDNIQKVIEINE